MRTTLLVILCLAARIAVAQEYKLTQFRVEEGLPSNVIKAVTQDSYGFFWIATDEGLVKFDGLNFTSYKSAMHSHYSKGFLRSRTGKLYVYGDLDLTEIINEVDTVRFRQVVLGTRNPTDSTLWFPKALYEDKDNSLWIAEPQSIVRYRNGKLNRFMFGIEDRSPQFLRSFEFFEDGFGFLYAVSYSGNVYMFDEDEYTFVKEKVVFPSGVNDIKKEGNVLWIAAGTGLYRAEMLESGVCTQPVRYSPDLNGKDPLIASHLLPLDSSLSLLSTFGQSHYIANLGKGSWESLPFNINTVNSSYLSAEGDIWMASNEGLILLQKNLFYTVNMPDPVTFIESIAEDTAQYRIYHCTMGNLYQLSTERGKIPFSSGHRFGSRKIISIPNGYFQSLAHNSKGLWASNAYSVYLINDDKISRRWDFETEGRFIHDINFDKAGNLWLSQADNKNVICIRPDFSVARYPIPLKIENIINCVREGEHGLYISSNGPDAYLFFKAPLDSSFRNISVPVDFQTRGDFNVTDLAIADSVIWMATSEGLIRYNGKTLQLVDLGDLYSNLPVKTVKLLQSRYLVFNNSFGLFRYDIRTGDYWRYDDSNGLPSNTITTRGIYVDKYNFVWVGTSVGLGVSSRALMNDRVTAAPHFISAQVNGIEQRFTKGMSIPFNAYFTLNLSCISFPSDKIQMQFRIAALDSTWRTIPGNELTLTDLPAGSYTLEARAKKNGGYVWSESSWLNFIIQKPFWQQTWFTASALLVIAFIAWSSFALAAYINRKRRLQLEALVNQRTVELKKINDELSMRNSELDRFVYSTSHDLSAPLKSIRGLIMVAKMEEPTDSQLSYLQMMEKSVKKLEMFIADVINYSRNTRTPVRHEPVNFRMFVQQLLDDHQYAPNYGKIEFIIEDNTSTILMSDEMRLKIIFNNLISNAIKFHFVDGERKPFVKITANEEADGFIFTVQDNGSGIHPQFKEKIFDMFFRATDAVQGSGLGLYILRETVHKLAGEVDVQTELGVGTAFIIRLPK
jgi:signal transduction histidine kinase/ligand-binding sensor domain-containing protein